MAAGCGGSLNLSLGNSWHNLLDIPTFQSSSAPLARNDMAGDSDVPSNVGWHALPTQHSERKLI